MWPVVSNFASSITLALGSDSDTVTTCGLPSIAPHADEVASPIPKASPSLPWWISISEEEHPWDTDLLFIMEDKQTPSSFGDIDAAVPVSIPETAAPLSVRAENDTVIHAHTAVHHAHSEPLLQPSHIVPAGQSSMQTIQPSALVVENAEADSLGRIRLGPNEFAVILPMDSRVKDDYERILTSGASSMRSFLASLDPIKQIPDHEVI